MYDVLIVGAGPAGAAAALSLKESSLKVALLDKDHFPRDKVCGDFVMARGIKYIDERAPGFLQKIEAFPHKVVNRQTLLHIDDLKPLSWTWVQKSYTLKREDFDYLLLQDVLAHTDTDFKPGTKIQDIEYTGQGVAVHTTKGATLHARIIIGADGAHSVVGRKLGNYQLNHNHYGGSVRAYFSGLQHLNTQANEVYINKAVVPGYFWLFPLSGSSANVGLGMHSRHITQNKANLKKIFNEFINVHPLLRSKMEQATMEGSLRGFGLPFYSQKRSLSGHRYMLTGDAASLIDPTNGEGIFQAIVSGLVAGDTARNILPKGEPTAKATAQYAQAVHRRFWREMRIKAWLVKAFADKSKLHRAVGKMCVEQPLIRRGIQRLM